LALQPELGGVLHGRRELSALLRLAASAAHNPSLRDMFPAAPTPASVPLAQDTPVCDWAPHGSCQVQAQDPKSCTVIGKGIGPASHALRTFSQSP